MEEGKTFWAIPEGYIPEESTGPEEMKSHETFCVLNTGKTEAHLTLRIYFSDRAPQGPYHLSVPPERTRHFRFNDLRPKIPQGTDYSSTISSDVPVIIQHTRLDSRQAANALITTIAYGQ